MDQEKRRHRQLKRDIKKAGNRKRRQHLKRDLAENPEEAARAEFDYGRSSSAPLNGIDRDATRKRKKDEKDEEE
jgi:hypothetical protein